MKNGFDPISVKRQLLILAVLCCTATMVMAGPNQGGVLLVHDSGLVYSTDTPGPPYGGAIPTDCSNVDIQAPLGAPPIIWKVYAAFPAGSSPRLQGLAWGMDITPQGGGYITVATGGMVNGGDFEVTQDGWPTTNGASVGQSFPTSGTKTTLMTEVYWFAGYAYGGLSGTAAQYFCAKPHSVQASMFVDDAPIKNSDLIADYGCLGFGAPGHVHCPSAPIGCCCDPLTGGVMTTQADCRYNWLGAGVLCNSVNCPPPTGACCGDPSRACTITTQAACQFIWLGPGTTCDLCPGACCNILTGGCTLTQQSTCLQQIDTVWHWEWLSCDPNRCPPPIGCCCMPNGTMAMTTQVDCLGFWAGAGVACDPNPCPAACCNPFSGECALTVQAACQWDWHPEWLSCVPNLCPQPLGCCCTPDGDRVMTTEANCTGFWAGAGTPCIPDPCPGPEMGACCIPGTCQITTLFDCLLRGGIWLGAGTTCDPYLCPGSCCAFNGDCLVTDMFACPDSAFWTDGGVCVPNTCPVLGACCNLAVPECTVTMQAACLFHWHPFVDCDPWPCGLLLGKCCATDGTCTVTLETECPDGSIWTAAGVCEPNTCPQPPPIGVCCWMDGSCTVTTQVACSGSWTIGGNCTSNPCFPFPVEEKSWGDIKNIYR